MNRDNVTTAVESIGGFLAGIEQVIENEHANAQYNGEPDADLLTYFKSIKDASQKIIDELSEGSNLSEVSNLPKESEGGKRRKRKGTRKNKSKGRRH